MPDRRVFISHASRDAAAAAALVAGLEQAAIPCWIASRDVAPGANYQEAIVGAIRDGRAVVVLISHAANASDEVKKELSLASAAGRAVYPVRLDGATPNPALSYELATRQWVEGDDMPALTARLAAALHGEMSKSPPSAAPALLPLPDKPSLVVLPFQNLSGDPEQEYFADGLVEDITTALSCIRSLFVIARNSAFTYKGRAVDIRQVGRDLGVRYVLEGSVRKSGTRVRITGQLIDAITGAHLWAERYDRDLSDIFTMQDEITASVAGVIEPALAEAEQQRVLRKPPDRLDAWEAYQRGLWHFHKYDKQDNDAALAFFRQAIALDTKFAPGHYGYALALQWDIWHFSDRDFAEVQGTPRAEAVIAVSLDDRDAVAHAVLAHMRMWGGEWEAAIAEARTGFALNPNSAFVISMLGCVLGFGGYREEALARLQQAMRASPHDPLTWLWQLWRASMQFIGRDFAAALETLHEAVRLRPAFLNTHQLIAASLAHLGRLPEARATLERVGAGFPPELVRRLAQRPPWLRPEDYALRVEGLRLAAGLPE